MPSFTLTTFTGEPLELIVAEIEVERLLIAIPLSDRFIINESGMMIPLRSSAFISVSLAPSGVLMSTMYWSSFITSVQRLLSSNTSFPLMKTLASPGFIRAPFKVRYALALTFFSSSFLNKTFRVTFAICVESRLLISVVVALSWHE
jgi:hypothetical protein